MKFLIRAPLILLVAGCATDNSSTSRVFLDNAVVVGSEPTCYECSIELERVQDIAEARDKDVLNGDFRSLVKTDDGVLITDGQGGAPMLFGPDGRLIRSITGRPGEPPAFIGASLMRKGAGDSIYVMDEFEKRITVLGPFLNVVRTVPVQTPVLDMAPLRDGRLLLVSPASSGDSSNPFAVVDAQGGASSPMSGTSIPGASGADVNFIRRTIAIARDGEHFWSAHTLRYAIEKRTMSGELVQLLERDADWFPPAVAVAPISPDTPPTPRVVGIWEDARGFIWVHTTTADGRWPTAVGTLNGVGGTPQYFVHSRDLYLDTRLEVIDPMTGALLATAKYDMEFPTFTPGPLLSRVFRGPEEWLIGELYSARLTGHPGG